MYSNQRLRLWFICSFWVLGTLLSLGSAQGVQVSFYGKVLDPTRAPIMGARITASLGNQSSLSSSTSDVNGEFSLSLEPGNYTVKIAAEGFLEASQPVKLGQDASETQEFVLQISPHLEAVTVSDSGYQLAATTSSTKTLTPLRDTPQSITVVTQELIRDQMMMSMGDVVRYVPGITAHQGENNRDQVIIR